MSALLDQGRSDGTTPTGDVMIVIGFDGSGPSQRALASAAELMKDRTGRIEVVYVAHMPSTAAYAPGALTEIKASFDEIEQQLIDQAGELLEGKGLHWDFVRRDGDVAEELLSAADELLASSEPDAKVVVVVGGSSRKLDRYLNSVPGRIIRRDRFRVVVVP